MKKLGKAPLFVLAGIGIAAGIAASTVMGRRKPAEPPVFNPAPNPYAQGIQELVGWKHDQIILDTPFSVGAHTFRFYKFNLPEGSVNVAIVGQFSVAADASKSKTGSGNNAADDGIEVFVLSEPAFTVWQNGYATSSVYESGRVSEGKVQAEIPAGAGIYYLVFSNKFATKTAKNVNADVLLRYKSWLPEWFRRMKDRFWNWLGL